MKRHNFLKSISTATVAIATATQNKQTQTKAGPTAHMQEDPGFTVGREITGEEIEQCLNSICPDC